MKKLLLGATVALLAVAVAVAVAPAHDKRASGFRAFLSGFSEVPATSTTGRGDFRARIENGSIAYTLRYGDLEAPTRAAHIHFAQRDVNGGVAAFLCGGGGKPACPPSGTVTGTIVASDVIGPAEQGIAAGELEELLRAMRHGVTYANVHTDKFPGGEIRGQIKGNGHFKGHFKNRGRGDGKGREGRGHGDRDDD